MVRQLYIEIQRFKNLKTLNLSDCNITPLNFGDLILTIFQFKELTTLDLSNNHVGDFFIKAVAKSKNFKSNRIKRLKLNNTGIKPSSFQKYPYVFTKLPKLLFLDLAGNNLGDITFNLLQDPKSLPELLDLFLDSVNQDNREYFCQMRKDFRIHSQFTTEGSYQRLHKQFLKLMGKNIDHEFSEKEFMANRTRAVGNQTCKTLVHPNFLDNSIQSEQPSSTVIHMPNNPDNERSPLVRLSFFNDLTREPAEVNGTDKKSPLEIFRDSCIAVERYSIIATDEVIMPKFTATYRQNQKDNRTTLFAEYHILPHPDEPHFESFEERSLLKKIALSMTYVDSSFIEMLERLRTENRKNTVEIIELDCINSNENFNHFLQAIASFAALVELKIGFNIRVPECIVNINSFPNIHTLTINHFSCETKDQVNFLKYVLNLFSKH